MCKCTQFISTCTYSNVGMISWRGVYEVCDALMTCELWCYFSLQAVWTPTSRGRVDGRAECSSSVTESKSEKVRMKPSDGRTSDKLDSDQETHPSFSARKLSLSFHPLQSCLKLWYERCNVCDFCISSSAFCHRRNLITLHFSCHNFSQLWRETLLVCPRIFVSQTNSPTLTWLHNNSWPRTNLSTRPTEHTAPNSPNIFAQRTWSASPFSPLFFAN